MVPQFPRRQFLRDGRIEKILRVAVEDLDVVVARSALDGAVTPPPGPKLTHTTVLMRPSVAHSTEGAVPPFAFVSMFAATIGALGLARRRARLAQAPGDLYGAAPLWRQRITRACGERARRK